MSTSDSYLPRGLSSDGLNAVIEEVRQCKVCEKLGLPFEASGGHNPPFRFPPVIGGSGPLPLLFVGINPRVSESNRDFHETLVRNPRTFAQLAENIDRGRPYIGPQAKERHYAAHVRLAQRLFPSQPFEAVAAVTEIFFCASKSSMGLPIEQSPCAQRYFERVLAIVRPVVVLAVGQAVKRYLQKRFGSGEDRIFARWGQGKKALVVSMPHPNAWGPNEQNSTRLRKSARSYIDVRC